MALIRIKPCILFSALIIFDIVSHGLEGRFGEQLSDKTEDDLFENMGQATVRQFQVVDGLVELDISIEDVTGIDELWVLDFQRFTYKPSLPVITNYGKLVSSNTGSCSNIYEDAEIEDQYFDDDFFRDFNGTGNKDLFNIYLRGNLSSNETTRKDSVKFIGNLTTLIECKRMDGSKVWDMQIYDEEIEANTVLYTTNVRPAVTYSGYSGFNAVPVAFVQSHISLIWRLSRFVIFKAVISSAVELQVEFDFAIVEPVLQPDGSPDPSRTYLIFGISTVSPIGENQMNVYRENSVSFVSDNPLNRLMQTLESPPSNASSSPVCRIVKPGFCKQSWEFKFELQVDTSTLTSGMPVGATGSFQFDYYANECENITTNTGCVQMDDSPRSVETALTLQTVIQAIDGASESITVTIVRLVNQHDEDLRAGKGVKHGENVTLEVNFSPAFLRDKYMLELQLFLVCIGEHLQYSTRGCLGASTEDRYTAFVDENLSFRYNPNDDPMYGVTEDEIERIQYQPASSQYAGEEEEETQPASSLSTAQAVGLGDLVAFWPMNSLFLLDDVTKGGNDGAISAAELVFDSVQYPDGAYRFKGKPQSYVEFQNNGAYDVNERSMTLLIRVYPLGSSGPIFDFNKNGDGVQFWQTDANDFAVLFVSRDFQQSTQVMATNVLSQRSWNFIGFTYAQATGEAKLWHDGIEVANDDIGTMALATQYEVRMGAVNGDNRYLNGFVTCVQVYDRALSSPEIVQAEKLCGHSLGLTNMALGKHAEQSSSSLQYGPQVVAASAIDGNTNADFHQGDSCTHTSFEFEPWWKVDLGDEYVVNHIVITNRKDCCRDRLVGAVVRVGLSATIIQNDVCGTVTSRRLVTAFNCRSLLGRYASVQLEQLKNYLTLCEVEVYADLNVATFSDVPTRLTKTHTIWRGSLNDGVLISSDGQSRPTSSFSVPLETAWMETEHSSETYFIIQKTSSQVTYVADKTKYNQLFADRSGYIVTDTFYASQSSFSSPSSQRFYSSFSLETGISYVGVEHPSAIDCSDPESGFYERLDVPSFDFPLSEKGTGLLLDLKDLNDELQVVIEQGKSFGINPTSLVKLLEISVTNGRLDVNFIADQLIEELELTQEDIAEFAESLQISEQIFQSNMWNANFLIDLLYISIGEDMTIDIPVLETALYGLVIFKLPAVAEEFQLGGLTNAYEYMVDQMVNVTDIEPGTTLQDIYRDTFLDGHITSPDLVNAVSHMIVLIHKLLAASSSSSDSSAPSSSETASFIVEGELLVDILSDLLSQPVDESYYAFLWDITLHHMASFGGKNYHLVNGEIDFDGKHFVVYQQECHVLSFEHQLEFYTYSVPYAVIKRLDKNGYDEWSPWSPCSRSCSGGVRSKSRTCWMMDKSCPGDEVVTMQCNTQECAHFTDSDGQILNYEVVEEVQDYEGAQSYCVNKGGQLARLKSEEAHQFVYKKIIAKSSPSRAYYLDMTDIAEEGIFRYSNNEVLQYATWIPNNPDNYHGQENCVTLWGNHDYNFNDYRCNDELAFICEYDFILVYKVFSGTLQNVFNLWKSSLSKNEYDESAKELDITQANSKNYKSSLVQKWPSLWIEEVKLVLYSEGQAVLELVFDGLLSDKLSWFSQDRLLVSPYSDILTTYKNYFSIPGHSTLRGSERRFFINHNYYGCKNDFGYLVVVEGSAARHVCAWERSDPNSYPLFLYSTSDSYVNWNGEDVGSADTLAIFIKIKDTDVLETLPEMEYTAKHIPKPTTGTELNSQEYDGKQKVHRVEFTNSALSGQKRNYVMTSLYLMVEVDEEKRRKRDTRRHRRSIMTSTVMTYKEIKSTIEVTHSRSARQRRNLEASAKLPKLKNAVFPYLGCPSNSVYMPYQFRCQCIIPGEYYNSDTFQCTNGTYLHDGDVSMDTKDVETPETKVKSSGKCISCNKLISLILFVVVSILNEIYIECLTSQC